MDEQQSAAWFTARLGKVTASRVKDVMAQTKSGPSASRKNYMMELLCERLTGTRNEGFTSKEMQRGTDLEPVARSAYEIDQSVMTVETGLVLHPSIEGFAASPDALVGDSGLLEIKCPNTANHIAVIQSGKHDPQYEWQMLAQMACTGRAWVDFVSFDDRLPEPLQYARRRFHFDVARVQEMETEIRKFLDELAELEAEMRHADGSMSAELIERLASSGMTLRQAAASIGMSYYQFRKLRDMHKTIAWSLTDAERAGLEAGRRPERYRKKPTKPSK